MAVLYEDRSVLAVDKPPGWMLAPESWRRTSRNLQAALVAGIRAREFWARSRNLKFIRFVHRLDADTSGVLLLARSPGALAAYSVLFQTRRMEKVYLVVVEGAPTEAEWTSRLKLAPDPQKAGKLMKVDLRHGKPSETHFRLLQTRGECSLVEARPLTGRTHQIRVHLAAAGNPVLGDDLYGRSGDGIALRAISLSYLDPFTSRPVHITAPRETFLARYGFGGQL